MSRLTWWLGKGRENVVGEDGIYFLGPREERMNAMGSFSAKADMPQIHIIGRIKTGKRSDLELVLTVISVRQGPEPMMTHLVRQSAKRSNLMSLYGTRFGYLRTGPSRPTGLTVDRRPYHPLTSSSRTHTKSVIFIHVIYKSLNH